jgi:hypothetical protein
LTCALALDVIAVIARRVVSRYCLA